MNLIDQDFNPVVAADAVIAEVLLNDGEVTDNDTGCTIGQYNGPDYEGWLFSYAVTNRSYCEDTYMSDELEEAVAAFLSNAAQH